MTTAAINREQEFQRDKEFFESLRWAKRAILDLMRPFNDKAMELLVPKDQIDEDNLSQVMDRAKVILPPEQYQRALKYQSFCNTAIDALVKIHLDWAVRIGLNLGRLYRVDPIEAASQAQWGLYRAIWRYDPQVPFQKYCTAWIRQVIERSHSKELLTLDDPISDDGLATMLDFVEDKKGFTPQVILEDLHVDCVVSQFIFQLPSDEQTAFTDWYFGDGELTPAIKLLARELHYKLNMVK